MSYLIGGTIAGIIAAILLLIMASGDDTMRL